MLSTFYISCERGSQYSFWGALCFHNPIMSASSDPTNVTDLLVIFSLVEQVIEMLGECHTLSNSMCLSFFVCFLEPEKKKAWTGLLLSLKAYWLVLKSTRNSCMALSMQKVSMQSERELLIIILKGEHDSFSLKVWHTIWFSDNSTQRQCSNFKNKRLAWEHITKMVNQVSLCGRTEEEVKRKKECYFSAVKKKVWH